MGVLEKILENQHEILTRIQQLEQNIAREPNNTQMITSREMIGDLGISSRTFQRMVKRGELPFLIRTTTGGNYRARKCDFEKWKKQADAVPRKRREVV
jgi:excisionase family DNA binding protein